LYDQKKSGHFVKIKVATFNRTYLQKPSGSYFAAKLEAFKSKVMA